MTRTFGAANFNRVVPIGASSSSRVRGSNRLSLGFDAAAAGYETAACGSAAPRNGMYGAPFGHARLTRERPRSILGAYALCQPRGFMEADTRLRPELCNCLALRQATRHVTQFYDQFLATAGLRTTQFS